MRVDADREPVGERMRRRFDVRVFPTILVLDSAGQEIDRLRGAPTASELIAILQMVFDTPLPARQLQEKARENPDDPKLQAAAGRRAAARGDFKSAQPFLARALELVDSKEAEARARLLSDLAQASFENDDFEQTVGALDRLYAVDESSRRMEWLRLLYARSLIELKRDREAFPVIREMLGSSDEWVRSAAWDLFGDLPKELRRGIEEREKLRRELAKSLEKQKFERARSQAEELLAVDPNDGTVHVELAEALFGLHEAMPAGDAACSLLSRAHAELRLGRRLSLDDADTYWTASRLTVGFHGVRAEPADAKARKEFEKAQKDQARGRYGKAAERYRTVLEAAPGFGRAFLGLGDCALLEGRVEEALRSYLKAAQVSPNNAEAFRLAADAAGKLGRVDESWDLYRQSLLADPDYPMTWLDLETWGASSGEGFERHASIVPPLLLVPDETQAASVLASLPARTRPVWSEYLSCKLQWRKDHSHEAPCFLPSADEEVTCLGRTAAGWDRLKADDRTLSDANLDFLRQLWIDGQLDSFVYLELFTPEYRPAFEKWKRQNRERALRYLKDYVFGQAQAVDREGYNSSALAAFNQGAEVQDSNPQTALDLYQQALRQEPYMLPALKNASYLYLQLQRYDDTVDCLRRWRELEPDSSEALHLLAFVFIEHGECAEALPLLEKAALLETDATELAKIEENIRYCQSTVEP